MRPATLRSRLVLGFALVTVPLVVLLIWNNLYATRVVHSQVAQSNQSLLTMYVNDMDKALEEIENYLYKTAEQDDSLISLGQNAKGTWAYYLAQTHTMNDLFFNTNYYDAADVLFAYGEASDNLLLAPQTSVTYARKLLVQDALRRLFAQADGKRPSFSGWNVVELDRSYALVRIVDSGYRSYIGAWVDLNRLMEPFHSLTRDGGGQAILSDNAGRLLSQSDGPLSGEAPAALRADAASGQERAVYNIVKLDQRYLLIGKTSRNAGLHLSLLLPERRVLEGLPYFRVLTYWVPVVAAGLLAVYLIFLQRAIVKPIVGLIRGMRRIRSGDLSARLEDNRLVEFIAINETFNGMATQIEHLKIDIYEEQIRTQKAELSALQAQIHPHFFMNSLNIVYHLAQTRSYDIIQRMSLHLVRYFRYATRTQTPSITIEDEMAHINDYLSIQKFRFPEALIFEFDVDPALASFALPPLTVQPLVENAMVHGFSFKGGEAYRIAVRVYTVREGSEEAICIEVADNGKGLAEGQAAALEEMAAAPGPTDGHVGLWNIVRRCRLFYKTNVKLRFADGQARGAVARLTLPVQSNVREGIALDSGANRR
ncbi:sensor histidine kinase [Cohnella sp. GCM10020058]|uniref:cache domain-containing sensor histidine kinase n=1 Tax=Cohnella sp. GCM10020058 TaxID=3317330 RepID=UPI00362FDE16